MKTHDDSISHILVTMRTFHYTDQWWLTTGICATKKQKSSEGVLRINFVAIIHFRIIKYNLLIYKQIIEYLIC